MPLAPGSDDLDIGIEGIGRELKTHLVIALARGAVGNRIGTRFGGDLDQTFGNQRAGNGGAQQVDTLINRIGAKHRENKIPDKFFTQVFNVNFLDAQHLGFLAGRFKLATLAKVSREGYYLGLIFGLQPFQDDRRIKPAGIGEYDFLDFLL